MYAPKPSFHKNAKYFVPLPAKVGIYYFATRGRMPQTMMPRRCQCSRFGSRIRHNSSRLFVHCECTLAYRYRTSLEVPAAIQIGTIRFLGSTTHWQAAAKRKVLSGELMLDTRSDGLIAMPIDLPANKCVRLKLRLGIVGGGRGAFIGAVHRMTARLDGAYELVAGALSSDPQNAVASGIELGIAKDRCYTCWRDMVDKEADRDDRVEVVAKEDGGSPLHWRFELQLEGLRTSALATRVEKCPKSAVKTHSD